MNRWLHKFMEKPDISDNTDISDRFKLLDKKMENMHGGGPDKSDRFAPTLNMSDLSGRSPGLLGENLRKIAEIEPDISDKTDRLGPNLNLSDLSGFQQNLFGEIPSSFSERSDLLESYEERLAIAEYDGQQSPFQANRIAYLDAFVGVLVTLPHDEGEGDWLLHRITESKKWLRDQGIRQPQ